jgi:hypothetical protein
MRSAASKKVAEVKVSDVVVVDVEMKTSVVTLIDVLYCIHLYIRLIVTRKHT